MQPVLSSRGLRKGFGRPPMRLDVLRDVDLEVHAGELVAVAGSSGSGKSTLLHVLGGLMRPDAGRVALDGDDLYAMPRRRRATVRNRLVGFVFQFHHLLPEFTALENVMLPALIGGVGPATARMRGRSLLAAMGLAERAGHKPGELSGGEQQRVAVARALVNEPRMLFADEPSGNLDRDASQALHALLEALAQERQLALLVATHSPALARRAHRVLVLEHGSLRPLVHVEDWA